MTRSVALALALTGLWISAALAEPAEPVTGIVVDAESGEPVAGAVVRGTGEGSAAITGADGRFELEGEVASGASLEVLAARYVPATALVTPGGLRVELTRVADDDAADGEVIEIEGIGPIEAEAPTYELTPEVIRLVPGAGNDALKSLQTMPSVARVPFGMGGLVLRGTSPRDSSVFLDGIEVPLLYHFGGLTSFYPSSLLESMELTPGGYSAEFGRGQGGIVVLESTRGKTDRWRVASELSMIDAAVRASGPAAGGAWSIAVRRSLVDAFLPLVASDSDLGLTTAPRYYDGQLRYDFRPWRGADASLLLFGSDDEMSLRYGQNDDKTFTLRTRFLRLGVRLEQRLGANTELRVVPWVGIERFHLASTFQTMTVNNTPRGGRAEIKRVHARGHVRAGLDIGAGSFEAESLTIDEDDDSETMISAADGFANIGLWAEASVELADRKVTLQPGLRLEHYALSQSLALDPRLVVSHDFASGLHITESVGLYHQPPTPADTLWGNDDLESSYSIQGTLGAEVPVRGLTVGLTGFYSELYNLAVDDPDADDEALNNLETYKVGAIASTGEFMAKQFGTFSRLINEGRGRNLGLEAIVKHVGERGFAWLAYTIARSRRRDLPGEDDHPYILDQTHVVTAVGSRRLGASWRVGARIRVATGNPLTPVIGATPDGEDFDPIYGPTLSERLPLFFQLDLRVDRVWRRPWGTISAFLDVQNVSRRANIEGRVYSDDYSSFDETRGLPLFPSFGVEYTPPSPP